MITEEDKNLAQWALQEARRMGCSGCRISLSQGKESSIELRNEQIDKWVESSERQMVITLFTEDRYGAISTNRLEKEELKAFIKEGIATTQLLEVDADRKMPEQSLYYKGGGEDLKQYDEHFEQITIGQKLERAKAIIAEMADSELDIISTESSYGDLEAYNYIIDSQGFEGEQRGTSFGVSAMVSIMDSDGARPEGFGYDSALRWDALSKSGIGAEAIAKAKQKLGQRKIDAGNYDAVIDREVISQLVRPLIRAMYGQVLHTGSSFLLNKLGESVTNSKLTLIDNPHLAGHIGARYYNNEGIATKQRTLIKEGVLQHYLIDPYYGRKLHMEPTINNVSLVQCELGKMCCKEMINSIEKGVYITGFNGGNCNGTTGDFSYGIEGLMIEKGVLTQPFSEMIITGNMLSFWQTLLELGNDPRLSTPLQIPSMVFGDVSLS